MHLDDPFYLRKLKEDLSRRQAKSPAYSLRAYARDLGLHPATVSMMLKGKSSLPLKHSHQVVERLGLSPRERTLFFESFHRTKTSLDEIKIPLEDERFMLDESYYQVIAEWEHYAVLTLFDCEDFDPSPAAIAHRLGITELRCEVVLNNLMTCGLVVQESGALRLAHQRVRTTEDVASQALKKSHLETLDLGKDKLESVEVALRDFSSVMIAVDPAKLTEAKAAIREFRQKMMALLRGGHRSEVFQLAIQFYPLTQTNKGTQNEVSCP